jgi:hypothetical protein
MDNSMDNFKLRLIYGQALCDGLNLGLEMQVAYVQDSTDTTNTLRSIMIDGENVSAENGIGATFRNGFAILCNSSPLHLAGAVIKNFATKQAKAGVKKW